MTKSIEQLKTAFEMQKWSVNHGKWDREGHRVQFKLTWVQWHRIWLKSGHLEERGRGKGKYCMSRVDDLGDYVVGNVFIQEFGKNVSDTHKWRLKQKPSLETRAKISAAIKASIKATNRPGPNTGRSLSPEHRAALSRAMLGKQNAKGHGRPKKAEPTS